MRRIILIAFLILFPMLVLAQNDGTGTSGGTTPPSDPTTTPDPSATGTTPDPTTTTTSTPIPAPTSTVTPKAQPAVLTPPATPPVPANVVPAPVAATESTPVNNSAHYALAALIAVLALIPFGYLAAGAMKKKSKKEDKKCFNIKKLLDEKLEELTDLKGKLQGTAQDRIKDGIRNIVSTTRAGETLTAIEKAEEEYKKLEKLYQNCIMGLNLNKKPNVFIFHGTEGYPEENWFPWLKEKLEARGCKVTVPQFPSPPGVNAKIEEWFDVLKKYDEEITEDTILIGHSLGGMFLLHFMEEFNKKIKAAVFVSVAVGYSFGDLNFDWGNIKTKTQHFIVFHSDDDPYVSLENGKQLAKNLGVELSFIPNAGHFNTKAGYTEFKELWQKLDPLL